MHHRYDNLEPDCPFLSTKKEPMLLEDLRQLLETKDFESDSRPISYIVPIPWMDGSNYEFGIKTMEASYWIKMSMVRFLSLWRETSP